MKNLLIMIVLTICTIVSNSFAQFPPIIDRELFFGDPEISGAQISPDGKYITFIKPFNNIRNIWVKEINQKFDEAKPITADSLRPVTGYFWSRDGKYILFVQDKGGDENYRVYAVDPKASGDPVPSAHDLTPLEKVRAMFIDVPRTTPNEIIVGLNDRNPQLHDVYRINITTGERTLIRKNDDNIVGWMTDLKGELRLGVRLTADGGTEILRIDGDKLTSIYTVNNEESASPIRFTPDGKKFYLMTNKGDKLDKIQLELYDLKSDKTKLLEKDPLNEVDFGGAMFSDKTNEILATFYIGEKRRMYPRQKEFEKDFGRLQKVVPQGDVSVVDMTDDEMTWLVSVSQDINPGLVYIFDRKSGTAELLYKSRPKLPSEHLANMKPVKYKARDGMTIYAYLTLPKGVPAKNLPTVLYIHGGPWARDFWGYNSIAQFLANRGYAVFQPNFRGSTGYGKKYLNAGNKQWGTGAMQHDLTDAVKFLIKEKIADPKRVAISGGSYGGYATLSGLAFTPDLYACGFDIVGPSNIITLLNSIPPYWAPIKKIFDVRVGDQNDPEDAKMLAEQSPLNYASNIKAPLFVVQGANDPRVKKAEADQIVIALRDLGRNVEYMLAPDEGHGFAGQENRLAMYTAMEQFFAKHLSGREQKEVRDAIQKKLDAITIDINSVTMPVREVTDETVKLLTSFDGAKVSASNRNYAMKIEVMGQKLNIDLNQTVSKAALDGKEVWRIIDVATGMMGGSDTLDVDMNTLLPIRRMAAQGLGTVMMNFTKDGVEGMMKSGPQEFPINAKFDSPVLIDGSGTLIALSTLPLKEGYSAAYNTFDMRGGKAKKMIAKVAGTEKVKLEAGEFNTFKVEIISDEDGEIGSTLWYNKDGMYLVKSETKLPAQMGGGTIVMELVK
ncbi:MAG: alpha/beta fold hydrolase [Bacteroidetes bacterium]|nr:alpha/beta fold hydrolase [Bacteroidota bacterium]